MIALIVISTMVILLTAYFTYGRYLSRQLELNDETVTPACEINDGLDFVPAPASMLIGQHFSAIAAAGPIVGPILAGLAFGWLPALLWIVIGSIFIGGVHDMVSMVASIRHKAASIGEIAREYMSPLSQILFLVFVWMALVYVIVAFTDITGQTFLYVVEKNEGGPAVAVSSFLYLVLGLALGVLLYKFKLNLKIATAIFLPLVGLSIWAGPHAPAFVMEYLSGLTIKQWDTLLILYCFVASLMPMWLLLQPRGYLGGWFLYATIAVGLLGTLFGGYSIEYPALNLDGFNSIKTGQPLLPLLFITIACGACSGFHAIISSGTTSKQIKRESDTRRVAYGSMLLEALVAVLALGTVMMLAPDNTELTQKPNMIYASGLAHYMEMVGIDYNTALLFALLAFSTFVYDTLDVSTRLARYVLQELLGWKSFAGAVTATAVTLALPYFILMNIEGDAYMKAWTIFGTSNQLLASITLLAVSVWLIRTGRNALYTIIPMVFMMVMTLWSLGIQIIAFAKLLPDWLNGVKEMGGDVLISGTVGSFLMLLTFWLMVEAVRVLRKARMGTA